MTHISYSLVDIFQCEDGVSTGASSPEKNPTDREKTNGTRIILRRPHDENAEHLAPKKPKFDKFDELKNSN